MLETIISLRHMFVFECELWCCFNTVAFSSIFTLLLMLNIGTHVTILFSHSVARLTCNNELWMIMFISNLIEMQAMLTSSNGNNKTWILSVFTPGRTSRSQTKPECNLLVEPIMRVSKFVYWFQSHVSQQDPGRYSRKLGTRAHETGPSLDDHVRNLKIGSSRPFRYVQI